MNHMIEYYEEYHKLLKDKGYTLERNKDSSRVIMFRDLLRMKLKPGSKVLDIGCGDFYFSKILPEFEWTGIDITQHFSDKIIKHDLCVEPYPLPDKEFDAIICSEVLEHLWYPMVVHKEAHRLLKDDGVYIISTPNHDNIDWILDHHRELLFNMRYLHQTEHIRYYNHEVHTAMLKTASFQPEYYCGVDAHFVKFFQHARAVLYQYFNETLKIKKESAEIDQLLGQLFPLHDSGILVMSRKAKT